MEESSGLSRRAEREKQAGRPRDRVQSVERAVRILRALKEHPEGLSLGGIAAQVGLARSTVQRLVNTLQAEELVVPVSRRGRVRLGPGLTSLATPSDRDLARELHPYLVRLSRELNETVDLALLEHDHVVFIDQVAAPRRLRAVSSVGAAFPAHCTATGKALLATLPAERVVRLLPERLERLTPATITDRADLLAELERVRLEGVAYDREEHTLGICALGAVVWDAAGRPAAVTVPLPAQRFYGSEEALAAPLRRACEEIEEAARRTTSRCSSRPSSRSGA